MKKYKGTHEFGDVYLGTEAIRDDGVGNFESVLYTPQAIAFFAAVEGGGDTLTVLEKRAVNNLVIDINTPYSGNLEYSDAIYPFVGGTSTSCKWNLVDPNTYPITWSGGMTFSSQGILGNASDSGGDTGLNPVTLTYASMSMECYVNDGLVATPSNWYDLGAYDGVNESILSLGINDKVNSSVNYSASGGGINDANSSYSNSWISGLCGFVAAPNNRTTFKQDDVDFTDDDITQTFTPADENIGIGCRFDGTIADSSGRGLGIVAIGRYVRGTSISIYPAIDNFVTTLGRD